MKMMRLAIFFAAGVYLGLHADGAGDLDSVVHTIRNLFEQFQSYR